MLLVACVPLQPSEPVPPLAVQALAPLDTQVNTTEPPAVMVDGVARNETMLAGGIAVVTETMAVAVEVAPPAPVQFNA
jgi:hypothetical protein